MILQYYQDHYFFTMDMCLRRCRFFLFCVCCHDTAKDYGDGLSSQCRGDEARGSSARYSNGGNVSWGDGGRWNGGGAKCTYLPQTVFTQPKHSNVRSLNTQPKHYNFHPAFERVARKCELMCFEGLFFYVCLLFG